MDKIKIFVEGVADIKFIKDLIEYHFSVKLDESYFFDCKGWTNLNKELALKEFTACNINDIKPIIIFDADDPSKDIGGFDKRNSRIKKMLAKKEIKLTSEQVFLYPNNFGDGDLEVLLEKIINNKNTPIFDCWNSFENCLEKKSADIGIELTIPARKAKIHTYCTTLLPDSNNGRFLAQERNRNYQNKDHWNLEHEYLNPLKEFLGLHITKS